MITPNQPAFHTWERDNLAKLCADLWNENIKLREALEQTRLDNRDLSKQLRDLLRQTDDDWK